MPSKSKAQHHFVAAKAAEGQEWAKEWLSHDQGQKHLPERKLQRMTRIANR